MARFGENFRGGARSEIDIKGNVSDIYMRKILRQILFKQY